MKAALESCLAVAKKNWLMILGIILIPFLYAILYVNAFWNPVDRLENLNIAVINLDEGTEYNGERVNYGDTIEEEILKDDSVRWQIEDESLLSKGIENTDYNMAFVINKDFSADVMAASDGEPQQGSITYIVDKRKNFVLSQYGNMIRTTFQNTVAEAISREYTETIYGGLKDMAASLGTAADGAVAINDGVLSAENGVAQLKDGAETVAAGTEKLSSSLNTVNSKMPSLKQGIGSLQQGIGNAQYGSSVLNEGLGSVNQNLTLLSQGAAALDSGLQEAQGLLPQMSAKLTELSGGLNTLADSAAAAASAAAAGQSAGTHIDEALTALNNGDTATAIALLQTAKGETAAAAGASAGMTAIAQNLQGIAAEVTSMETTVNGTAAKVDLMADGASSLNGGLQQLAGGVTALTGVSSSLNGGLATIAGGMDTLSASAATLADGSAALADGSVTLNSGASRLAAGLSTLENGLFTLSEGTSELSSEMEKGAGELTEKTLADTEAMADFIVAPVNTEEDSYGTAETYGMGFSPFFISLSCWLGAVLLFFVVPVRPGKAASANRWQMVFGPMPVFAGVSVLQALLIAVGTLIIGVHVNQVGLMFLMIIVMSLSFALFIQFLNLAFGLPGRGCAVIILIFQLCSCGGTFPVELISRFFALISPYMPFTYTVKALKEIMFGGDMGIVFTNMLLIMAFGAVSLILSLLLYNKGIKHDKFAEVEA